MPDFSKGKIYKLVSNISSDVYIGSCLVELSKRFSVHKCKSNTCISKSMFVDDAIITIVLITFTILITFLCGATWKLLK